MSHTDTKLGLVIMDLIDRVSFLKNETKKGKVSEEVIDAELSSLIRMVSVNLKYSGSAICSMSEVRNLVDEFLSFLGYVYVSEKITSVTFQKNLESLSKVLRSCETLPQSFLNDLVSRLDKSIKLQTQNDSFN